MSNQYDDARQDAASHATVSTARCTHEPDNEPLSSRVRTHWAQPAN